MAQTKIRVRLKSYEARKTALENSYLKISNEVRTLDGTWHGEASEKFKAQFDTLYGNLKQNETVMSNVISNLKTALSIYQEQEAKASALINSLEEGTIYKGVL